MSLKKIFFNNPLASKLALLKSNPPVSKLTSPLSGGTREAFDIFYFCDTLAAPERGGARSRSTPKATK